MPENVGKKFEFILLSVLASLHVFEYIADLCSQNGNRYKIDIITSRYHYNISSHRNKCMWLLTIYHKLILPLIASYQTMYNTNKIEGIDKKNRFSSAQKTNTI